MSVKSTLEEIKQIRVKNNDVWMELVALAIEVDPIKASKILERIKQNDQKVTALTASLVLEAAAEAK